MFTIFRYSPGPVRSVAGRTARAWAPFARRATAAHGLPRWSRWETRAVAHGFASASVGVSDGRCTYGRCSVGTTPHSPVACHFLWLGRVIAGYSWGSHGVLTGRSQVVRHSFARSLGRDRRQSGRLLRGGVPACLGGLRRAWCCDSAGGRAPHLRRDWGHPCHICAGTALASATRLVVGHGICGSNVATWCSELQLGGTVCGLATCCTVLRRTSITASARSKEAVRSELCACDARLQYSRVPPGAVLPSAYSTLEYRQGPKLGSIWCVASTITHTRTNVHLLKCVCR